MSNYLNQIFKNKRGIVLLNQVFNYAMRWVVLIMIRAYQRWISPYKGFSCAYRLHAGGQSCSGYGYDVVRRFGAPMGMKLLRRRMTKCGEIFYRHCHHIKTNLSAKANFQSGHCDVAFDGCDPSIDGCDVCDLSQGVGDILSSCTPAFGAGCGSSNHKSSKKLKYKPLPKSL
jgi:putative component of membrane protein insertase Oxa1/YidC/SpoIIIJ protein YidD